MSLKRDAIWTAADTFVTAGLAFSFRLLVARVLAPHDFGIAAIALTVVSVLESINDFGLTATLIHKDQEKVTPTLVNTTFTASLIVSVILAAVTAILVAPIAADFYSEPLLQPLIAALAISLLASPFATVSRALLNRQRRFKDIAVNRCIASILSLALAGLLLWLYPSPWVVIFQSLAAAVLSVTGMHLLTRWRFRLVLHRRDMKEVFGYSGFVLTNDIAVSLSANAGVFVLGRMVSASDAGLFSLASYMTDAVRRSLMSILNRVTFVHYSQMKHDKARLRTVYLSTLRWNCRAIFPIMTVLMLFGPANVGKLLGSEWEGMGSLIVWLSLSVMIHAAGGTTSTLYKAIGRPGLDLALFMSTTLGIFFPGIIVGASIAGVEGVAIATAVTKLISNVIRQILLDRIVGSTALAVIRTVTYLLILQAPIVAAWIIARTAWSKPLWIADLVLASLGLAIYGMVELPRAFPQLLQRFGLPTNYLRWMPR